MVYFKSNLSNASHSSLRRSSKLNDSTLQSAFHVTSPPQNGTISHTDNSESSKNPTVCSLMVENSGSEKGRAKIFLRFRTNNRNSEDGAENSAKKNFECNNSNSDGNLTMPSSEEETCEKTNHADASEVDGPSVQENKSEVIKKKRSPLILLAREEIEDDILAMLGSKQTRRTQKRPKNLQRQLDKKFPGLHLDSIAPNRYKVR